MRGSDAAAEQVETVARQSQRIALPDETKTFERVLCMKKRLTKKRATELAKIFMSEIDGYFRESGDPGDLRFIGKRGVYLDRLNRWLGDRNNPHDVEDFCNTEGLTMIEGIVASLTQPD